MDIIDLMSNFDIMNKINKYTCEITNNKNNHKKVLWDIEMMKYPRSIHFDSMRLDQTLSMAYLDFYYPDKYITDFIKQLIKDVNDERDQAPWYDPEWSDTTLMADSTEYKYELHDELISSFKPLTINSS